MQRISYSRQHGSNSFLSVMPACRKLPHLAGNLGPAIVGAGDGSEAEGQALKVAPGAVGRLPALFDRAQEFPHGTMESLREPGSAQSRAGIALCRIEGYFLV